MCVAVRRMGTGVWAAVREVEGVVVSAVDLPSVRVVRALWHGRWRG